MTWAKRTNTKRLYDLTKPIDLQQAVMDCAHAADVRNFDAVGKELNPKLFQDVVQAMTLLIAKEMGITPQNPDVRTPIVRALAVLYHNNVPVDVVDTFEQSLRETAASLAASRLVAAPKKGI